MSVLYRAIYAPGVGKVVEYERGELKWVHPDYDSSGHEKKESHYVMGDLPGYESPATGNWIEGRAARRDDFARSGCRPYEGREQELKEAARRASYDEQKSDARLHEAASRAFYQMPESKRRTLSYL